MSHDEHFNDDCDLCRLHHYRELKTRLHFENEEFIVVDCLICLTPMIVKKRHEAAFSLAEKQRVGKLFIELFGEKGVIDWEQRKIPDHAHCHLRPRAFPGTFPEPLSNYA